MLHSSVMAKWVLAEADSALRVAVDTTAAGGKLIVRDLAISSLPRGNSLSREPFVKVRL
jgi:hypothetical protein